MKKDDCQPARYTTPETFGVPRVPQNEAREVVARAVQDEVSVSRQVVATGKVRVVTTVQEREAVVDEVGWEEIVDVQRVPVERVVDAPVPVRTEGDTTIISVVEEQVVVQRRLVVKEEVRLTTRRVRRAVHEVVSLREQRVDVLRLPADEAEALGNVASAPTTTAGEKNHG